MTTTNSDYFELPAGAKIEFLHRFCPRCGLNLVEEPPHAEADQEQAQQINQISDQTWPAGMQMDLEPDVADQFERMVAPLTEAEKESAKRYEQCWLSWQNRHYTGSGEQENRKASTHEHLVPMIKRQFFEWIGQLRRLF